MQYADVIVTVRLAEPSSGMLEAREPARTYTALIYTNVSALRSLKMLETPPGVPPSLGGYPLVSVETLRLHWDRYRDYLAQFLAERKSPGDMSRRLFDAMSPGLERVFGGVFNASTSIRVWWNPEAVELEDFPWELVAYTDKGPFEIDRFSFVRGLPPDSPPSLVPLDTGAPLRVAIMAEGATGTTPLEAALTGIPGLQVERLSGSPREMLQQAARSNFELLHLVCDGIASLAYDGILYFHGATSPELTARELAASLRPTRTVFVGLSSTYVLNPDVVQIGYRKVPSVYRAFAYLASAHLPLPTIMVPVAPAEHGAAIHFWRTFYAALSTTLSVEAAVAEARKVESLPVALHLRHPLEQQFRRRSLIEMGTTGVIDAPAELGAELKASQNLVQRLESIRSFSNIPLVNVHEILAEEKTHQERLWAQLNDLAKL
jgi:hypothetical protein